MTLRFFNSDISVLGVAITAATEDTILIDKNASIVSTGDSAIFVPTNVTDASIQVDGTVAGNDRAIDAQMTGGSLSVQVSSTGRLQGADDQAIRLEAEDVVVVNAGTISGVSSGSVSSTVFIASDRAYLQNSGTIFAGPNAFDAVNFTAVSIGGVFINTGEVIATNGVDTGSTNVAYRGIFGVRDEVYNSGLMAGNVALQSGDDLYDGRGGTVIGNVAGGFGDDTYIVDDAAQSLLELAAQGTDTVEALVGFALEDNFENLTLIGAEDIDGTGNDAQNTIEGNAGDNKLTGLGSRDTINGHAGDDAIDAGRGNDVVDGGEGDDAIAGRAGDDILNGGNGSDFIFGGIGSDTINGGSGDDRIKGGAARDELTGAAGSDTFIFCSVTDSTLGPGSDRISDFEVGNDKLDFTNLISGQLTLASGSHTGGGTASVFTSTTGSGNTNVLVDVDGDGSSDMRVVLLGSSGLTETDFIL